MKESLGGISQNGVEGSGNCDLRLLHNITADANDPGGHVRGNVAVAKVGARGEDLAIAKGCKSSGRSGFGRTIAMTGEDEDAQGGLGRASYEREEEYWKQERKHISSRKDSRLQRVQENRMKMRIDPDRNAASR